MRVTAQLDDTAQEVLGYWLAHRTLCRGPGPETPLERLEYECAYFLLGNDGDLSMLPEAVRRLRNTRGRELEREACRKN